MEYWVDTTQSIHPCLILQIPNVWDHNGFFVHSYNSGKNGKNLNTKVTSVTYSPQNDKGMFRMSYAVMLMVTMRYMYILTWIAIQLDCYIHIILWMWVYWKAHSPKPKVNNNLITSYSICMWNSLCGNSFYDKDIIC